MKCFAFSFNANWILSKENPAMPMQCFIEELQTYFDIVILDTTLSDCRLGFKDESLNEKVITIAAQGIVEALFPINSADDIMTIDKLNEIEQKKETNVLEKIDELIGAEEFKHLAHECAQIAPRLKKYNAIDAFVHRSYLFSINDGNGLSTYLQLFAELLEETELFRFSSYEKVIEERIHLQRKGEDGHFSTIRSHLHGYSQKGKIMCIDISEWMTKSKEPAFRDFLAELNNYTDDFIFVFRIPFVEKEILERIKRNIADVLFVETVSFAPFTKNELQMCAKDILNKRGFTIEDKAWEIFETRIIEEKSDGRFYGINTIIKIVREMIYRKQLDNAIHDVDDFVIKASEIEGLAPSYNVDVKRGLELLDDLVGMEQIKERVSEIITQIEISTQDNLVERPCIHMRFVGNPGTGKTTVARIIGQILKDKKVLRNGSFFEYSGRDFCGRYVGETAPKTAAMCRDAYGSVLFIDEAYSLYYEDRNSNTDYGREAIDTLIAEMENHRSDLVVIMAGYPEEMDHLMTANVGLESRMPYVIEFPNYSREQLFVIYMNMAKKRFVYDVDFERTVKEYFSNLSEEAITAKEFSNARFVRNLFERTWGKAAMRSQLHKIECNKLTKEDFLMASAEKEFNRTLEKQNKSFGF